MLVHDWRGIHRNDSFRGWWAVAQSTVGPLRIVVFPPFFDDDLRFLQGIEDFAVLQFEVVLHRWTVWQPG